jgi:tetratricopeptide (TPR) repeat protein
MALQRGQPLGYQHTVAATWSLALHQLRETHLGAVELLALLAFLAPDNLPQPLLAAHHNKLPEPLARVARDPLALGDTVAALRRYSLVRVVADGLFVHRLLQTVVRSSLDADAERAWTSAAVRLLRAEFPDDGRQVVAWPECERLLPHVLAVLDHAQHLDEETNPRLWLLTHAAGYLWSRGQYRQALTLQEEALAGYQRTLGNDHPTTLASMELARTRWELGDPQTALELHQQALAGYRRVLGNDHPSTLWSMSNLAATITELGDLQAAYELHKQVLTGRRRVLGEDHPDTLTTMKNLAATRSRLEEL